MGLLMFELRCLLFVLCLFAGCGFTPANEDVKLNVFAQADAVEAMVFAVHRSYSDETAPQPKPDNTPSNECTNCYGTGKSGDGISTCTVCKGTGVTEWDSSLLPKAVINVKQPALSAVAVTAKTTTRTRWRLFRSRSRYVTQRKSYSRYSSCSTSTCRQTDNGQSRKP